MVSMKIAISSAVLLALVAVVTAGHHAPGYSYAKFSGPVSGPEKEVYVEHKDEHGHGHGHGHAVDYVAKPDYHFAYGVEDPKSKVSQSRKETRLGDAVHGEYSVVDPNGVLRVVKYTADKHNGFQAEVITSGGHKQEDEVVHYGHQAEGGHGLGDEEEHHEAPEYNHELSYEDGSDHSDDSGEGHSYY